MAEDPMTASEMDATYLQRKGQVPLPIVEPTSGKKFLLSVEGEEGSEKLKLTEAGS